MKHDRVTKYEGVHAILCTMLGLGAGVLAVEPVGPRPAFAIIAAVLALCLLRLGVHYASVWQEKRAAR